MFHVSERMAIFMLFVSLMTLFSVIYLLPQTSSKNDGPYFNEQSLELRFRESVGRFSTDLRNIEKRLNAIEKKMFGTTTEVEDTTRNTDSEEGVEDSATENSLATPGEIKQGENCLDSMERGMDGKAELYACHKEGGNQFFEYKKGKIKHKEFCLTATKEIEVEGEIFFKHCSDEEGNQTWELNDNQVKLAGGNFCMTSKEHEVFVEKCNNTSDKQKWQFKTALGNRS